MSKHVAEIRRITLRVPDQLHEALAQAADEREVSLNQLAVEALAHFLVHERGRYPLKELSVLLAPAARSKKLDEQALSRRVKEARRRIWRERYKDLVATSQ